MPKRILNDASIHFTIKTQSLESVKKAFEVHDIQIENVHHCFLSIEKLEEKGIPTGVTDWVESIGKSCDCWYDDRILKGDDGARQKMLCNLRVLDGVAVFIGDITEGVKTEWDFAQSIGLEIIHINV